MGGRVTGGSWRYRTIKHYRRRAVKFRDKSDTIEGKIAWSAVIQWFDDILSRKHLNKNDSIVVPLITTEELDEIHNSHISELTNDSEDAERRNT